MRPWQLPRKCSRKPRPLRRTDARTSWCASSVRETLVLWRFLWRPVEGETTASVLFRRESVSRRRRAEPAEEHGFLCFRSGQIGLFDMSEAADFEGQRSQLDGCCMVGGGQPADDFLEHSLVFPDQAALRSPLLTAPKDVEWCAAQAAELCQNTEDGDDPGPVGAFAQMPALGIAIGKQRRGQVEMQLVGPLKAFSDALEEIGFRV